MTKLQGNARTQTRSYIRDTVGRATGVWLNDEVIDDIISHVMDGLRQQAIDEGPVATRSPSRLVNNPRNTKPRGT